MTKSWAADFYSGFTADFGTFDRRSVGFGQQMEIATGTVQRLTNKFVDKLDDGFDR